MEKCRILAIDFGEKRTGLAVSDELQVFSRPLLLIDMQKENAIEKIAKIVDEMGICKIIVGNPVMASGEEGETSKKVRAFVKQLELNTACSIELYDERFTSKIAEKMLIARGISPSRNKGKIDMYAASLLLQEYLDSKGTYT